MRDADLGEPCIVGLEPALRLGDAVVEGFVGDEVPGEFLFEGKCVGKRMGKFSERPFACRALLGLGERRLPSVSEDGFGEKRPSTD